MTDSAAKSGAPPSPALQAFLRNATALVLDQSSSSRPVIRRMLSELGVEIQKVKVVETYEQALDVLEFHKPQIVFTDYELGERTALDLLRESGRFLSGRASSVFVVIAAESRPALAASVGEGEVDVHFVRPLVVQDVRERFLEAAALKADPSPYEREIDAGRKLLEDGKDEEALQSFRRARRLDPKPAKACYFEGVVHRKGGESERALASFAEGLSLLPNHYSCLVGIFEVQLDLKRFDRAYEAGMALADYYPIHPKRVPDMIRLCILNERYSEVLRFTGAVSEAGKTDETLSKYVSAGLFVCGKHLLRMGQADEAIRIFSKAEVVSQGKPSVLREILVSLYSGGLRERADEMLSRVPLEVSGSPEVRLAILEALNADGPEAKTFLMCQELLKAGVSGERLYEIALLQAKGLERPQHVIEDLCLRASAAFPEHRERFESIVGVPADEKGAA